MNGVIRVKIFTKIFKIPIKKAVFKVSDNKKELRDFLCSFSDKLFIKEIFYL